MSKKREYLSGAKEHLVSDALYQAIASKKGNSYIRIISIDEKTVKKYGKLDDWSRDTMAEFLSQLNRLEDKSPSVIGFDLLPSVLDDEAEKKRLIEKYLSLGRDCSQDTLHGAFLDVCIDSSDQRIFEVSDLRVRQSMEIAKRMGLRAVIFHTNYILPRHRPCPDFRKPLGAMA